ncbi:unnamed protein product [Candidula unifasciata]|uniref:G-protein coupled receptors family 1 profile domain-containing protein n=1 Tax=Candidula unifasciata TaxID=100452 RepID=A0A8S3ZS35_9EUPU|nr:unnamed protein product [Candidula unifasciata]
MDTYLGDLVFVESSNWSHSGVMADSQIVDDATTWIILRILMLVVTPTLSVMGVVGNCFSIAILTRQGLKKSSHILLVSLAVSDITYLVAFNSVPKIIYEVVGRRKFDCFSQGHCHVLFVLFVFFTYFDYVFWSTSFTLPTLITLERLVVIFFPLSCHRIVTPSRTWFAVSVVFLFWLSVFVYPSLWYKLRYVYFNGTGMSIGFLERADLYQNNANGIDAIERLNIYLTILVSPILTVVGCVVILIKVKLVSIKRKKMTKREVSTNRTTKMLLAICGVYVVAASVSNLPLYLPDYFSISLTDASPTNMARVMYQVINIFAIINSSCNFVVYVVLNKSCRRTFWVIVLTCHRHRNNHKRRI